MGAPKWYQFLSAIRIPDGGDRWEAIGSAIATHPLPLAFTMTEYLLLIDELPVTDSTPPLLMLVDGHSLAFRSYYAHAKGADGGLRTSTGIPTSVCYGFLKSLLDTVEAEKPQYAAIAFDLDTPTFRHEAAETYKEGRPEAPDDFLEDVQNLQELLQAMRFCLVTVPGYEADDVIGTLSAHGKAEGYRVKILSGDQDLFQLIDEDTQLVSVLYLSSIFAKGPGKSGAREFLAPQVEEKLGVRPSQVVDYKALCGDASDNIPGVKGIGAKTAVKLLNEYGSLDAIYADIENIKGATQKKLQVGREDAYHSQFMARIVQDVALPSNLAACHLQGFDTATVEPLLKRLELHQFIRRLPTILGALGGAMPSAAPLTESAVTASPTSREQFDDPDLDFFTAEETAQAQAIKAVTITPRIITTEKALYELLDLLSEKTDLAKPVAWDTETTSLTPRDARLVGIGCCWGAGLDEIAYIPVGHQEGTQLPTQLVLEALRPILEGPDFPKVLQNAKYDRLVLRSQGITLAGVVFDTMLASYVLNPESSHNLSDLTLRYLNQSSQSYDDLVPKGQSIAGIQIAAVANYCGADVHTTYRLAPILRAELAQLPELEQLFFEVELPLETVLADMEYQGIRIDADYLAHLSTNLEADLRKIEEAAYAAAGKTLNLGSPKQLSELLFDTLGLDKRKSRKNKSGGYSTDATTLEKLEDDHPVVPLILQHRTFAKLKSTYVDALPELVRRDTQRVHTDFNQAITATGRLSSSNPNLQNIPIRTEFSRKIRAAFVPEPAWKLVSADYSQIELRILAHLSEEPVLVAAYNNQEDVHALTARLLFEKDDITPDERRLGKIINFGVIYGMGANRFAREAGVSRTEAKTFIDRYYERYPKVFDYLNQMQREAIAYGYVQTLLGRRRYVNFTSDALRQRLGQAPDQIDLDDLGRINGYDAGLLRAAANAPIQGSSADIIKIAMIRLHEVLKDYQARLLLQVHDELVLEVPPDEWAKLAPQLIDTMQSAVPLRVPLVVEAFAGPNWMEAK
jgi:DNA polymerase-1